MLDLLRLATLGEDLRRLASHWWGVALLAVAIASVVAASLDAVSWLLPALVALFTYCAVQLVDLEKPRHKTP